MLGARRSGLGSGRGPGFLPSGRRSSGWAPAVVRGKPSEPSTTRTRWNTFTTHLSSKNVSGWTDRTKTAVRPPEGRAAWTDGTKSAVRPPEGRAAWTDGTKSAVRPPEGRAAWTDGAKTAVRPPEGRAAWTDRTKSAIRPPEDPPAWTDGRKKRRPGGRLSSWGSSLPYASRAALSSSIILMTHIGIRVPGPKMAAAPALYRAS